jgi:hypothetical protein
MATDCGQLKSPDYKQRCGLDYIDITNWASYSGFICTSLSNVKEFSGSDSDNFIFKIYVC